MASIKYLSKFRNKKNKKSQIPGLFKVDLHMHTCFSNDSTKLSFIDVAFNPLGKPEELYIQCIDKGMNAVTFTDHDTIDGCKYFLDRNPNYYNKTFFFGVELLSQIENTPSFYLEFNIFKFTEKQYEEFFPLRKNAFELIEYLNKNKIPFQLNHPYWYANYFRKYNKYILEIAKKVPAIETINGHRSKLSNFLAGKLAIDMGKGKTGGSDTHAYNPTMAYTAVKAKNLDEFFEKFLDGKTIALGKSRKNNAFIEESASIFNNSWKKIIENAESSKAKAFFYYLLKMPAKLLFKGIIKSYTILSD